MGISGQLEPSSGFWFRSIAASNQMQCQYSLIGRSGAVDVLCREEIIDGRRGSSWEQLEDLIRHHLPDAMRFGTDWLPTSVFIIAHGTPGHIQIGKRSIPVFELVRCIKKWSSSAKLQHVHLESCAALQGVTTYDKKRVKAIKDVIITGYDQSIGDYGVDISQRFGSILMHTLSLEVAALTPTDWEELNSERLWHKVEDELREQLGPPTGNELGAGASESNTFSAFRVI